MIVAGYILVDRHGNPLRGFGGRIAVYPDPYAAQAMARVAAAVAAGKQISYLDPAKAGIDVEEALACA